MKTFSQPEFKNLGDDGHTDMSNGKQMLKQTDGNGRRLPNESFPSDEPSATSECTHELQMKTFDNYEFHVPLPESDSELQSSNSADANSKKPYSHLNDVEICRTSAMIASYNSVLQVIPEDSLSYSYNNLASEDQNVSTYDQMPKLRSHNNDENEHYDHLSNKTVNSLEWNIDSTYDHTPVTKENEYDLFE